ncbi:MAG: exodeoxyribonuclease VII large subunit, partial [bacterium]
GMKVLAQGSLSVYERRGQYQFEVIQLQPAGIGELQIAFEQLKAKLREEGLFAEDLKRPIPRFPDKIGIVTSPTGAAIRDMVSIFGRRFPGVELILAPVRVQGEGAAEEISRAIKDLNQFGAVDLIIVGRGGGSLEDLWPFNEEVVARAIHDSRIPIISAVGHEVDFSIADFVADLRAPTPSAAAELAVPNRDELIDIVRNNMGKLDRLVRDKISYYRERVGNLENSYALRRPSDVTKQYQQRLDDLTRGLEIQYSYKLNSHKHQTENLQKQLISLSPQSILSRGYSLCFRDQDGKLVKLAEDLKAGDKVRIQFYEGQAKGKIDETLPGKDFQSSEPLPEKNEG